MNHALDPLKLSIKELLPPVPFKSQMLPSLLPEVFFGNYP
jgi:hypothetical protein